MKYETIFIEKAFYKNEKRLLLKFGYDQELIKLTKQLSGAKWSKTLNAWHIADTKENFNSIYLLFKGKAWLNWDALKNANEKREHIEATRTKEERKNPAEKLDILNEEGTKKIEQFKFWLRSKRYSESTIDTYTNALKTFLRFYNKKDISEITNEDVILFNNEYILANEFSSTFQNQVVNAIKLFFSKIRNTKMQVELIHRPKREKLLPNVLSKEEIKAILEAPKFLKHKAMLSLMYSCGLRSGELLRLKPEHIDSNRNLLIIKQSKGKKDRIVPLSDKTLELLRTYFKTFKPEIYLFEGEKAGNPYDERSLQQVLKQSIVKAKINKPVTLHWLRHSYATHLLENGTDLRYIQEILGHSSSKTTEIYTHVSTKSIQKIKSPFDFL